jgi:hypothetical protein
VRSQKYAGIGTCSWRASSAKINQELLPLLPLDRLVNREILLDLLPQKAEQSALDSLLVSFDEIRKELEELATKGLPEEVLEGLRMLKGMKGLKEMLQGHASKLAEIFTSMATQDELGAMGNSMADMDAKQRALVEKQAMDLVQQMASHSADWQKNLNALGQSVHQTYKPWMSELEAAIRER